MFVSRHQLAAVAAATTALLLTPGMHVASAPSVPSVAAADGWSIIQAESYSSSSGSVQICGGALCYLGANAGTQYNKVDLHTGTTAL